MQDGNPRAGRHEGYEDPQAISYEESLRDWIEYDNKILLSLCSIKYNIESTRLNSILGFNTIAEYNKYKEIAESNIKRNREIRKHHAEAQENKAKEAGRYNSVFWDKYWKDFENDE